MPPRLRTLAYVLLWGGLSLFVRHIGLFYLIFAGAVILKLGGKAH